MDLLTISEICIKADACQGDLIGLDILHYYVIANIKKYPLVEINFMLEHINELIIQQSRREFAELIFPLLRS